MASNQASIDNLILYISSNEVVYQAFGEIVEISNDENPENRNVLLEYLSKANNADVYQKGDSFIHEPFEDIDNWATKDDYLFLLQIIGVVICIPKKLAVENNLIVGA